ncbi:ComEC/Rec2 family competence protein [Planctomycetaceae bacterium SH139]
MTTAPLQQIDQPAQSLRLGCNAPQTGLIDLPAVRLAFACAAGVLIGLVSELGIFTWFGFVLLALPFCFFSRRKTTISAATTLAAIAAMAAWHEASQPAPGASDVSCLAPANWEPVVLRGVVHSCVEIRQNPLAAFRRDGESSAHISLLKLTVTAVRDGQTWRPMSGGISTVVQGDATHLLINDQVTAYGHWQEIRPPSNPGSTDLRDVYALRGIGARLRIDQPEQLEMLQSGRPGIWRAISWISAEGNEVLNKYVGEEAGALAAALVLGRRRAVSPETHDRLVETGTVHLLSVSGLHLAMVATLISLLMLLTGWRRTLQIAVILGFCIFYAALTGARPPVLRASILVGAVLLATWAGRQPSVLNSLALAAITLLVLKPNHLFDTGTQLSFLAVITLVVAGRGVLAGARADVQLERLAQRESHWLIQYCRQLPKLARQSLVVSFWMWVATMPLVWHAYKVLAPISILANLVMMIPLSISLVLGLITTSVGLLAGAAAAPFGWACEWSILLLDLIVRSGAAVPYGHFWLPAPPAQWVGIFYLVILLAGLAPRIQPRLSKLASGKALCCWTAIWLSVAIWLAHQRPHDSLANSDSLAATFIDVGHGTSVLLQLPKGQGTWLYDAGSLGDPQWSSAPIEDTLWAEGISQLDGIIISHADADHYNAIPDLLRRFHVGRLVTPPGLLADRQRGLDPLRRSLTKRPLPVDIIAAGDLLAAANQPAWAACLHPPTELLDGSDNANSIVLVIQFAGRSLILPGDLEMPGTDVVIGYERPTSGGVLMAPHHGSVAQDASPMLQWARPKLVIVSGGERARQPEVKQMLSQNGADVLVTAELGAIQVIISPAGEVTTRHWQNNSWQTSDWQSD